MSSQYWTQSYERANRLGFMTVSNAADPRRNEVPLDKASQTDRVKDLARTTLLAYGSCLDDIVRYAASLAKDAASVAADIEAGLNPHNWTASAAANLADAMVKRQQLVEQLNGLAWALGIDPQSMFTDPAVAPMTAAMAPIHAAAEGEAAAANVPATSIAAGK